MDGWFNWLQHVGIDVEDDEGQYFLDNDGTALYEDVSEGQNMQFRIMAEWNGKEIVIYDERLMTA